MATADVQMFDIEQAVREWAWRQFDDTATKKEEKLRKKEKKCGSKKKGAYIGLEMDWSEVRFKDETKWNRITDADLQDESTNAAVEGANCVEGAQGHPRDDASKPADEGTPQASVLFQTKFTNTTGEPQSYTCRTEKVTKTTCSTQIDTCYTRGIDLGITLKAPGEFMEANVGYSREYSITNMDGQTFEQEMHWGLESTINVKAGHEATARLVVDERKQKGRFTIESLISGMVFVTFTNIRDNNSMLKATGHPISEIVKEYLERERRKGHPLDYVEIKDNKVRVVTKGMCNFRYGFKQHVKVDQVPLPATVVEIKPTSK